MKKKVITTISILSALVVLAAAGGFGYLYLNGMSKMPHITQADRGQIKVACIGASGTYGHGIFPWPAKSYPAVLNDLLGNQYHVNNFGVSGSCVQSTSDQPYINTDTYQEALAYEADILVISMGSNDSKPENWKGEEAFKTAFEDYVASFLVEGKEQKVFICTTAKAWFPEGVTEGTTNYDLQPAVCDQMVAIMEQVAQEKGYYLVDLHGATAANPQWYLEDCVHFNNEGAAGYAQVVYDAMIQALGEGQS